MNILHKDLVALKQYVDTNDKKLIRCVGICHNINHRDAHKEPLKPLMARWPEGTGCPHFPVPYKSADYDYDDVQAYTYIEDLWVGEYGAARIRLLDFLIEETKP